MALLAGRADYWKPGDWNGRCQECNEKYKFSQLKFRWDQLWVCWRCFENRHPQDFLRGIPDIISVPNSTSDIPVIYVGEQWDEIVGVRLVDAMLVDQVTIG